MKKISFGLCLAVIAALAFLTACKSSSHCAAYQDSRIDSHSTITQYHSRG
ncbi:MAG: hypothetical protein HKL88_08590 [Bacteroidia bacterium]|nr:hypothetical protein [Bacteroidia bacterium]